MNIDFAKDFTNRKIYYEYKPDSINFNAEDDNRELAILRKKQVLRLNDIGFLNMTSRKTYKYLRSE